MLPTELRTIAVQHFGPVDLVADLSWPRAGSEVYHIRDATGADHILKRLVSDEAYLKEYCGLRSASALGPGRAPKLEAADPRSRTLILTLLPGALLKRVRLGEEEQRDVYGEVGALLRRLHDSVPAVIDTAEIDRLLSWAGRHHQQLADELPDVQRSAVRMAEQCLSRLSHRVSAVPTHGDLWARNILFDVRSRNVAFIDFGEAATAPAVRDLFRLESGEFQHSPHVRDAFYEGYGRQLDTTERQMLQAWAVLDAACGLIRGLSGGDIHLVEQARAILDDAQAAIHGPMVP